jgi:hypothetical protein
MNILPRLICLPLLLSLPHSRAAFERMEGIEDVRIRRVAVTPALMAVASDNALYLSRDGGGMFSKAHVLKGEHIRHISINRSPQPAVYVAGNRHGYRVAGRADRIFSAKEGEELHFLIEHDGVLYAAGSDGLYYAEAGLLNWKSVPGLSRTAVYSVEGFGSRIYLACAGGVYAFRPGGSLRRLFVARTTEDGSQLRPMLLRADRLTSARLWLCTSKGLFISADGGESWRKFYVSGIDQTAIHHLLQPAFDPARLYLCTASGFFEVNVTEGISRLLYEGLPTADIRWSACDTAGTVYLATARGLFRSGPASAASTISLETVMQDEPPIDQVQMAALRYNSVHPEKIERWRKRLRYRALLPRLSLDYDKTIGYSVSGSGKYFGVGPYDWGVSLTWDMGNLLWNSYEDDVDNRSRLTTQLRIDILDEVNRLYFERLRLKQELLAAARGEDAAAKELRLNELTATLDGYTGGLYSGWRE